MQLSVQQCLTLPITQHKQRLRTAAAPQHASLPTIGVLKQPHLPKLRGPHQHLLGGPGPVKTRAYGAEQLLADSALPIIKIVLCCCVGAVCAKQGLIDLQARRTLSRLAIDVFTPALMIAKLAPHINLHHALELWPIGANVITCHLVGLCLGILHTKVLPTPDQIANIIRVSTAISNVGNLPLVMVMSFVKNPNLHFHTPGDAEMAISYVMLGWFYATMIQMPLGHFLLHKGTVQDTSNTSPDHGQQLATAPATAAADTASPIMVPSSINDITISPSAEASSAGAAAAVGASACAAVAEMAAVATSTSAAAGLSTPIVQHMMDVEKLWQSQIAAQCTSSTALMATAQSCTSSGGNDVHDFIPINTHSSQNQHSSSKLIDSLSDLGFNLTKEQLRQLEQFSHKLKPLMKGVVSAPLIAGLVAIAIGSCPPLRDAMFTPGGSLSLLGDVFDMMGQPLIPTLLLVLGANLAAGPGPGHLPVHSVLGVLATRLVLLPILGSTVVLTAQGSGLIHIEDPLALVVMMVAWSTPTAILVHSLASVHRNGEDEVSALLFWEYLTCIVTLPLCSAAYLYLLGCVPQAA